MGVGWCAWGIDVCRGVVFVRRGSAMVVPFTPFVQLFLQHLAGNSCRVLEYQPASE
jgi:hypothetical protein